MTTLVSRVLFLLRESFYLVRNCDIVEVSHWKCVPPAYADFGQVNDGDVATPSTYYVPSLPRGAPIARHWAGHGLVLRCVGELSPL